MSFNYILIFVSTGLFCFIMIRMITRYLLEKLELNSNKKYEALRRFIAPEKLLTGRIFAALIVGCVMFILQLVFGVEQMKIAIPVSCGFGILAYYAFYWYFLKKMLNRNQRQLMPEEAQYAYLATVQALEHARLDQDYIDSHEVGVIYGNDSVAEDTMIALDKFRQARSTVACGSGAIFKSMNSNVTMNLATLFHLKGINLTASAACAEADRHVPGRHDRRSGCRLYRCVSAGKVGRQ